MQALVGKVRRWWRGRESRPAAPVPFVVECPCGRVVEGLRQSGPQVVPCPRCRTRLFVLPLSPLPPVLPPGSGSRSPRGARPPRRPRRLLLALGGVILLAAAGGLALGLRSRPPPDRPAAASVQERSSASHVQAARAALTQGMFHTAAQEMEAALAVPGLSPARRRHLTRLRRQARLLADLLEVPLEDVLRQASVLPRREWQAVLARRYRGRSVVLDAEVSRSAGGRYSLDYLLFVGPWEGRVEVGDLHLVRALHLDHSYRVIIGARLAGVDREPSGVWLARLEPDSGVLLTDRDAMEAACPALGDDPELDEVLKRQREWLDRLP